MKRTNTIQEIAGNLGLSRVTVSLVLNGKAQKHGISEKTIARVNKFVDEAGFVPSAAARKLRMGDYESIGILYSGRLYTHLTEAFNSLAYYFFENEKHLEILLVPHSELTNGVRELISRGIRKLIWIQTGSPDLEFAQGNSLINMLKRVDTIIYNYNPGSKNWNKQLKEAKIKYVMVDRSGGFQLLAEFLKETGHRSAALGWSKNSSTSYHEVFQKSGLKVYWIDPENQLLSTKEWAYGIVENYLHHKGKKKIDAICTLDDMVAGHLMNRLNERGINVPEDITVTGFDGMEFGAFSSVPLTTLKVPVREMVDWVIKSVEGRTENTSQVFKPELILRSSHMDRLVVEERD